MIRYLLWTMIAMSAVGSPSWAQSPPTPLRIGWVAAMANAPALIADQKGFFAQEGLKVELKPFGDGPVIQQAMASGDLDVGYIGAPPVYQWFSRGLDSRILAKVNYGQAAIVAKASGPIAGLSDLRGRRLAGVARGSGMDVLLRGYVLKDIAALDPETDLSLSQLPVGNMNAALDTGTVDAVFSWEPFVSQALLRGSSRLVFDVNAAIPGYPWYVVMAPIKTLKDRSDDLVKLLRAHRRAIAFLRDHPAEADRIIAREFKLEAVTAQNGRRLPPEEVVAEARKRLGWADELTASDRAFIQRLMDYSRDLGFLARPLKVEQIVDDGPWKRAVEQN
ncbi:ABC transporter substrate-binding protein [Bradyrhizobium arachidis]|uniref:Aliphatic sulfonate ABC transporter substrate-binding protein n=1 Tax=Bradyrhizobium arachidis TaxID=858423 RepID=A0AAE7NK26_9BRAD|nr:ABC transporter substrate-binding protein [Bradyrhizobium arachidis]QOZ67319.1 aliphatic sulfonate ABC transporter substrate-binding protein [Bradyrhizobium arachidis]SFU79907.1 NitT/TauT family transport system substrate-binding protein [Bradyrhizobium arachidis]